MASIVSLLEACASGLSSFASALGWPVAQEEAEMTEVLEQQQARDTGVTRISHWIGGKSVEGRSGRSGPVFNPATGEQSGEVDFASVEEIDAAVASAKEA